MVECRTPEREVGVSILTQSPCRLIMTISTSSTDISLVAVLYPLARYIYLPKSTGNTQEAVRGSVPT